MSETARSARIFRSNSTPACLRPFLHLDFLLEDLVQKVCQNALEIPEGDVVVHHKALDLMEDGRVGGIIVVPINCPRGDNLKRGLAGFHDPNLNG